METMQLALIMHHRAKPLQKENPQSARSHGSWENHGEIPKAKGGTHAPKLVGYRGHPWGVSGFGEK